MGLGYGVSFGQGVSYFFHSASLRKKNTGLSAPLSKSRARPGLPWPGPSRLLRRRRLIINLLSDAALDTPRPRPPPGGSPPGSALHNRCIMQTAPYAKPHPATLTRGRPSRAFSCNQSFRFIKLSPGASLPSHSLLLALLILFDYI